MSTTVLQQFKESAIPSTWVPNAIYYIANASYPDLMEVYVVNNAGTAARHVINRADVETLIATALSAKDQLQIVSNIAARDALAPIVATWAYVQDATGDPTVLSGGATYLYNTVTDVWIKSSEAESMDVVLNWASIQNKPTSTVAAIDAAVAASHTHANKAQLDLITQSAGGNLLYNAALPVARWESTAW